MADTTLMGQNAPMLYDDGKIACDSSMLVIRRYYPWGSKKIPYASIKEVRKLPMSGLKGKYRIWGSGDLVHWWNLDTGRPRKDMALEIDLGRRIIPTISPDDAESVERIANELRGG